MRVSLRLLVSPAITIALSAAVVVAIPIFLLLAANVTITNAQQQQQPFNQTAANTNGTTLFQSIEDGVKMTVPEGWVIQDVNNTGSALLEETKRGYGILAQLCPEEEQQGAALSNASGSSSSNNTASCHGSEGNVIHIIRYPDLDTRLQVANNTATTTTTTTTTNNNSNMTIDNILSYHMQKLEEVGYKGIEIVNSADATSNVTNARTNQAIARVPAKNVEMTYSTNFAPNETRTGYFILTATNVTAPIQGTTKGYSIFYEGNSATTTGQTTIPSGSLAATQLPPHVRQALDSFELVTAAAPAPSSSATAPAATPPPAAPPTVPLAVEITSSDTEGKVAPATFEFDADVTGGTEPYTYSWDFDDGEESNEQTVSHTFEEAGSYDVGLTVTDSGGQSTSDSMEITVEEAPAEEEDNDSASNDSIDVDGIINDLFDRLGLR